MYLFFIEPATEPTSPQSEPEPGKYMKKKQNFSKCIAFEPLNHHVGYFISNLDFNKLTK